MPRIPKPKNWGSFEVEPYSDYRARLPKRFDSLPGAVIETWIYRHWLEFQQWLPLRPLDWRYESSSLASKEILQIRHVSDWMTTLTSWGDDLFESATRRSTWLGSFMLEHGTTPSPMIIAFNAGSFGHPREHGLPMCEPFQIIEGHMRLAYLQALVRRQHSTLKPTHNVIIATLPT